MDLCNSTAAKCVVYIPFVVPCNSSPVVQEPEVWHLLKDLQIAAQDHNTGSVLLHCCMPSSPDSDHLSICLSIHTCVL